MLDEGRHALGRAKGRVLSRLRAALYALAYGGSLPSRLRRGLLARFWEDKAESIHVEWGSGRDDYRVLGDILRRYRPARLLDAGCGSGRLFPLYRQCGVERVVGVDVSETALAIAREAFPTFELFRADLNELDLAADSFDMCICNRVLQHVLPGDLREVIERLCRTSRTVYINELAESDELDETFFMHRHDYREVFCRLGLACLESGSIGKQTYYVFGDGRGVISDGHEIA